MLQSLPQDLTCKILDILPSLDRARLVMVCKSWRTISLQGWVNLSLVNVPQFIPRDMFRPWLEKLAAGSEWSLQTLRIKTTGMVALDSIISSEFLGCQRKENKLWFWCMSTHAHDTCSAGPISVASVLILIALRGQPINPAVLWMCNLSVHCPCPVCHTSAYW